MIRRALFLLPFALLARAERPRVQDEGPHLDRLNEFVALMNVFTMRVNDSGIIDLKAWKRARRAFHRLEGRADDD